jgi:uncharacterized protein YrrD
MDIRLGVPVEASDGRAGKVDRLVYDSAKNEVVGIVVVQGWLLPHDVVVPAHRVTAADEQAVRVDATVDEVSRMPSFSLSQYVAPPDDWIPPSGIAAATYLFPASPYLVGAFERPVPAPEPAPSAPDQPLGTADIGPETEVSCVDGHGGHVDRVLTDGTSDRMTHLVIRRGHLFGHDVVVPAASVARIDGYGVHLSCTVAELEAMPRFEPPPTAGSQPEFDIPRPPE